jgi:hypothetical protein
MIIVELKKKGVINSIFKFRLGLCLLLFFGCEREPNSPIHFSNGKFVLSSNHLKVEVDPNVGGRITSFKLGDRDIILQKVINKQNYGSTLWPSPQNWPWPPSSTLDRMAYASFIQNDTLFLTSYPDQLTGLKFSKSFWMDQQKDVLRINYTITNISNHVVSVGPWEVTRVAPGGLSFFPVDSLLDPPLSNLKSTYTKSGITWFQFKNELVTTDQKLFQGGKSGWLAHINNGLLFVKSFPDITPKQVAPGQGEVEIFANEYHTYVELENHGTYSMLEPGESLYYPVSWYLQQLDPAINAELFNEELLHAATRLVTH